MSSLSRKHGIAGGGVFFAPEVEPETKSLGMLKIVLESRLQKKAFGSAMESYDSAMEASMGVYWKRYRQWWP
ncbi:unnamed protein product [Arabis nemorensis]|uniref:Uncharacterized protein n=1 Tax=Arabis nemorensis TaxID=586526 RepID=A0A565BLJ3_9BRAS|nr:unnamed protein product [Arabis nemorensis]